MRETMSELIIGDDHMLPSILELFPDVDQFSNQPTTGDFNVSGQNEDNGNLSDASEREWKFDPETVKSEVDEVQREVGDPFDDPFVDLQATTENNVESSSQNQKPQRRRRRKLDSDSDDGDATWSLHTSRTKKKPMSAKTKRRKRLTANTKRESTRRKVDTSMTPEQNKSEVEGPRVRRAAGRKRKGEEMPLKLSDVEDETTGDKVAATEELQKKRSTPRKKVTEMTPEELEKARATWREEKLRQRGSIKWPSKASSDADSVSENENSEGAVKKHLGHRKRVSEMNSEELEKTRIRWREEKKRKDERARMASKSSCSDNNGDNEDNDNVIAVKSDPDFRPVVRRAAGGRRKRISEMTDEEREVMKARWREESRLKRQRQREKWTEEERREFLAKQNERKRQLRQAMKEKMNLDQKREVNRKIRESRKGASKVKSPLTEEQKREAYQRRLLRRLEREAMMTEEEKEEKRQRDTLRRLENEAKMSPEELAAKKNRKLEYARLRLSKMSEEDKQRRREKMKHYRDSMTPERKSRFLARLREAHYRRMDRLRQDPEKLAELKEKWQTDKKRRQEYLKEWKRKIRSGEVSREEMLRQEGGLKGKRGRKPLDPNEYSEDQLRRRAEKRKTICVKARMKRRLKVQQMLDSGLSMEEISRQTETPEQRQRRLMRNRIDSAKIRMRKKLEAVGAPPKVIEEKLIEVAETYQPKHAMRPYKPRESRRKPLDETELAILETWEREKETRPDLSQHLTSVNVEEPPQPVSYVELAPCTSTSVIAYANVTPTTTPVIFRIPAREVTIEYQVTGEVTHFQQCHYQPQSYSHSQISHVEIIAPQPLQSQTYTLQQILNTMDYQQQSTVTSISGSVDDFVPQQIQQDYSSSTVSHVAQASPGYSAPSSPIQQQDQGEDIQPWKPDTLVLENENENVNNFHPSTEQTEDTENPKPDTEIIKVKKRTRTAGSRKPRAHTNLPDWYKTGVARGPKKKLADCVLRDAVCEECGNAYAKNYITEHKRQMHNPEFKDGRCVPCGKEFRKAKEWYYHYSHEHLGLPKKPKPGEGKRAMRKQMREMGLIRVRKEVDPLKNPYMCPQCGASYSHPSILESHEYHMHGEGAKEENYFDCMPCEKKFKRRHSYIAHMRKKHEGYKDLVPCERCDIVFRNVTELNQHIHESHQDSYFPCKFCSAVKLSEVAWRFHTNRCAKVSREQLLELRKQWKENGEPDPVDRLPVNCEFCPRRVLLLNVRRHYKDMHGLDEERMFQCMHCRNTFKSREYYSAHLESVHRVPLEECLEICRKYNRLDREGLLVKNTVGEKGGTKKSGKMKNARRQDGEEEMSEEESESINEVKKRGRKKRSGSIGKKTAKQRQKVKPELAKSDETELQIEVTDDSKSKSCKENSSKRKGRMSRAKRNKSDGECFPDEEEVVPNGPPINPHSTRPTRHSARMAQKLLERLQKSDSDSEEDDEGDYHQQLTNLPADDNPSDKSRAEVKSVIVLGEEEGEPPIKIEFISLYENQEIESEELHITPSS